MTHEEKLAALQALATGYSKGGGKWQFVQAIMIGLRWAADDNETSLEWIKNYLGSA